MSSLINKAINTNHNEGKYHKETLLEHLNMVEKELIEQEIKPSEAYLLGFYHDIGKVFTETFGNDDFYHYYGHETVSAHIFYEHFRKGKYNYLTTKDYIIGHIIRSHMNVWKMKKEKQIKILEDLGEYVRLLIQLGFADKRGRKIPEGLTNNFENIEKVINLIKDMQNVIYKELRIRYEMLFDDIKACESWINNSFQKHVFVLVGSQGQGKTYYRKNILIPALKKDYLVINYDEYRQQGLDIQTESRKTLKRFKEDKSIKYLIIDNTNINRKHRRRNGAYDFLTSSAFNSKFDKYNVLFLVFNTKRLEQRVELKPYIPIADLIRYDGDFQHPVVDSKILRSANATIIDVL